MTEVNLPILLDANLGFAAFLHPVKGALDFNMVGAHEATLTLADRAETIPMHRFVRIYNRNGFAGIFRRTSRGPNIGTDNSYTLRHGIDILQDSIWDSEETFEGTKAQFLEALLAKQTALIQGPGDSEPRKPWALGTCADTSSVTRDVKYDNLLDLLEGTAEEGGDYYFTYDQTVWPWTVSLVAKPSVVESEFRLDRNLERCQIKDNDSELCTRLILNVNHMEPDTTLAADTGITVEQNVSGYLVYNNLAAQANYGIITKVEDIDTESVEGAFPSADAWAADYLARRAEPMLQVEIDGTVLKEITGDDWDESRVGTLARVALPDYTTAITERCVRVRYPDLYGAPDRITVSLANALPTVTSRMKATQQAVARNARAGRSSARKSRSFEQHFQITDDSGKVLKQAGMKLNADGLLVYADDNVNMVGSRFNVQADKIGMVVGTNQDGNYIKAGEICLSINASGESTAVIDADKIKMGTYGQSSVFINDVLTISSTGHLYAPSGLQVEGGLESVQNLYLSRSLGAAAPTNLKNAVYDIQIVDNQDGTYTLQKQYCDPTDGTWHDVDTFERGGSADADDILLGDASATTTRPSGTAKTGWRTDILDAINNRKYFKFKGTISGGTGSQWFYIDFS